jgi:hypothetical protein
LRAGEHVGEHAGECVWMSTYTGLPKMCWDINKNLLQIIENIELKIIELKFMENLIYLIKNI